MNLLRLRLTVFQLALLTAALLVQDIFSPAAHAQDVVPPSIVSVTPADGASGVPNSASVVFVFSEAMDPDATFATFITTNSPPQLLLTDDVWSNGDTRLTCTPVGGWQVNAGVQWVVSGSDLAGNDLSTFPFPFGRFSTGAGGGQGGTGTNVVTTFQVGVTHQYWQASTAAPVLDPELSFLFNASTVLASNRTATNVTLTLPTTTAVSLNRAPSAPELFLYFAASTNAATFNPPHNGGNYTFNVRSVSSNQSVTVNLPSNGQPNAPRVSNFAAAQAVNAAQPFTLTWDAFTGGFSAGSVSNFIMVEVEDDFPKTALGDIETLPKTAASVTIPAGRLTPDTTYEASVSFWSAIFSTSAASPNTMVWRVTRTTFPLVTTGGGNGGALVLTNWSRLPSGKIQFEVLGNAGHDTAVEQATLVNAASWTTVLVTNTVSGRFLFTESSPTLPTTRFFRARKVN